MARLLIEADSHHKAARGNDGARSEAVVDPAAQDHWNVGNAVGETEGCGEASRSDGSAGDGGESFSKRRRKDRPGVNRSCTKVDEARSGKEESAFFEEVHVFIPARSVWAEIGGSVRLHPGAGPEIALRSIFGTPPGMACAFYRIFSFGSCKDNPAFADNDADARSLPNLAASGRPDLRIPH